MIKIENEKVLGFEAAIRGMRNPMNSWNRSDSFYDTANEVYIVGENDLRLMINLAKSGCEHRKYLRMICVSFDITAPVYFMNEFDTYKIGVTRNSTSFMHKGLSKDFEISDFEIDKEMYDKNDIVKDTWIDIITTLNCLKDDYYDEKDESYFHTIREILPMSYKYRSTISLNYEVLLNIYIQRKNHRLPEWKEFCKWILTLPYMKEIIKGMGVMESEN